jgi:hypothetical protein
VSSASTGVAELIEAAVGEMGIEVAELAGKTRKPEIVRLREIMAVVGIERYGVGVKALAEALGKSRVTVSTWVSRGAKKRIAEPAFARQVDELDTRIAGRGR